MKRFLSFILAAALILTLVPFSAFAAGLDGVQYASGFSGGLAHVSKDGKSGVVNTSGKLIFPLEYDYVLDFSGGAAIAYKDGANWLLRSDGAAKKLTGFSEVTARGDGLMAAVKEEGGLYGYIDDDLKYVIQPKYRHATQFSGGVAAVANDDGWIMIDKTGKELTRLPQYSIVEPLSDGLYRVMREDIDVFLDKNFKEVLVSEYEYAATFSEGMSCISKGGKLGFMDKSGKKVIDFVYDNAYNFSQGLAPVSKNGYWGYINKQGKVVIDFIYEDATTFEGGAALVMENGMWKIISLPQDISGGGLEASLGGASAWAKPEIRGADAEGLIPADMLSRYTSAITRRDFCRLMVRLIEADSQLNIGAYLDAKKLKSSDIFSDISDFDVSAAAALGIVDGIGGGKFNPQGSITREQAAKMLTSTGKLLGLSGDTPAAATFSDASAISSWAKDPVAYVSSLAIMTGDAGKFNPKGIYTREQSFATVLRLFKLLG